MALQEKLKIVEFAKSYFEEIGKVGAQLDVSTLEPIADILAQAIKSEKVICFIGNGGSAAIANHLLCDFSKGIASDTELSPRVVSFASSPEIITALGNNVSFDEIYSEQVRKFCRPGDVLFSISSSGNSPDIVNAISAAKEKDVTTVALTGFDGGRSRTLADYSIHVQAENYGVVEDMHQSLLHILAQHIRCINLKHGTDATSIKF